jgi:hypothetical protein
VVEIQNSILSIKNGNDNVRIEDNCLEEELATTPILSEIRTLSLTFVMLMRFFARLNIYYKTFLTRMQCDTTPFTSCCHNVDFCIAFLRQSANNYRHCSFCAQISPVVLKNKPKMSDISDSENEVDIVEETLNVGCVTNK